MSSQHIHDVTDAEFKAQVLDNKEPVLIDFWAPWCAPCRAIAPDVEALASAYAGKIKVCKMNIDESQETPSKYGVRGIPTLLMFKGGKVVDQVVGKAPKAKLEEMLKKTL